MAVEAEDGPLDDGEEPPQKGPVLRAEDGTVRLVPLGHQRPTHVERCEAGNARPPEAFGDDHVEGGSAQVPVLPQAVPPQPVGAARAEDADPLTRFLRWRPGKALRDDDDLVAAASEVACVSAVDDVATAGGRVTPVTGEEEEDAETSAAHAALERPRSDRGGGAGCRPSSRRSRQRPATCSNAIRRDATDGIDTGSAIRPLPMPNGDLPQSVAPCVGADGELSVEAVRELAAGRRDLLRDLAAHQAVAAVQISHG